MKANSFFTLEKTRQTNTKSVRDSRRDNQVHSEALELKQLIRFSKHDFTFMWKQSLKATSFLIKHLWFFSMLLVYHSINCKFADIHLKIKSSICTVAEIAGIQTQQLIHK